MKKKWTWSDLIDRSPWGLATLLWAHTTIVAVLLVIVAVYPSEGLFRGRLGSHLSRQVPAVHQSRPQGLAKKAGDGSGPWLGTSEDFRLIFSRRVRAGW